MSIRQWFSFLRRKPKPTFKQPPGYFISTTTQSRERVKRLGLPVADDNVLDRSRLKIPAGMGIPRQEYKPYPELEWIIEVEPVSPGKYFVQSELIKVFDLEWRQRYFATASIYGLSSTTHLWTYVSFGDEPERYDRLQIGIALLGAYSQKELVPEVLLDYINGLKEAFSNRKLPALFLETEPLDAALEKARRLRTIQRNLGSDFYVILQSSSDFSGMRVWQVLTDAGLQWGDGDLFHWDNLNRNYGDDRLLSVWTSTEPGYFFPEAIKAGKHHFKDLQFGFVIARNADPIGVYEVLLSLVDYCQGRLGGVIFDREGKAFDAEKGRSEVLRVVEGLKVEGLAPGEERAMRMF